MNPIADYEKNAADPFAADIFASETSASAATPEDADFFRAQATLDKAEKPVSWNEQPPKLPRASVRWDELERRLPHAFSGELTVRLLNKLAQTLNFPDEKTIEFLFVRRREITNANDFAAENCWWLTAAASETAEIVLAIEDALAVWLIDAALLGADAGGAIASRSLTPTELAVVEFFALNLAHEANVVLEKPQFQFRRLSRQIPDRLRRGFASENFSLLALEWQTAGAFVPPSVVKIYCAPEALEALQSVNASGNTSRQSAPQNLPATIKSLRSRLFCGAVELNFGELAALETGDVLLLENHQLFARDERLAGRAEIFCGDGDNQKLIGELTVSFDAGDNSFGKANAGADDKISVRPINFKRSPQIVIENFTETKFTSFDNFMIESKDNLNENFAADEPETDDEQTGGLAVENLVVSLRVELEARRLTLGEISSLRENRTLELGIRPTDEVNILIDDRIVGRGELVAVEDRLGVRITKLMR